MSAGKTQNGNVAELGAPLIANGQASMMSMMVSNGTVPRRASHGNVSMDSVGGGGVSSIAASAGHSGGGAAAGSQTPQSQGRNSSRKNSIPSNSEVCNNK